MLSKVPAIIGVCGVAGFVYALSRRKNTRKDPMDREKILELKFAPQDGITFYFFPRSPCARRVWLTLLEKNIKVRMVMVNLLEGEQRSQAYLRINPQGKVHIPLSVAACKRVIT